ncbi:MAG: N-acetylmuramoyl-L-alanine amidase [Lachnospiraceae bacterium]|nr:N-acetylmuramoyl-L-alanine amidase [Lachnospiraceae bacterium]
MFAYDEITIVIDPGHGGADLDEEAQAGAIYSDSLIEKDVDLITAKALYDELSQYPNLNVYMTRFDDTSVGLKERVDFAESVGADLMISVHYNASLYHIFYGSEIYISAFGSCYTTGCGVGSCIMKRWVDYGLDDKGVKTRLNSENQDYYGVIRHGKDVNLPVIIIEHGYLDNPLDFERLGTEELWNRIGRIDAEGVADYYGVAKNVMSGQVTPTVRVELPDNLVFPDETAPENISVELGLAEINGNQAEYPYTIKCDEPESRMMYYNAIRGNLDDVKPDDFAGLKLWGNRDSVIDTLTVPADYSGPVVFRIYNTFGLYTDYTTDVEAASEEEEEPSEEEESVSENEIETTEAELPPKDIKPDTGQGIEVEKPESNASQTISGLTEVIDEAASDSTMIYGIIFVLATIVFILLIIIIALIRQGVKENRDEEDIF